MLSIAEARNLGVSILLASMLSVSGLIEILMERSQSRLSACALARYGGIAIISARVPRRRKAKRNDSMARQRPLKNQVGATGKRGAWVRDQVSSGQSLIAGSRAQFYTDSQVPMEKRMDRARGSRKNDRLEIEIFPERGSRVTPPLPSPPRAGVACPLRKFEHNLIRNVTEGRAR